MTKTLEAGTNINNQKCFTLLELVIVIVIIGTALGLVLPKIGKVSWGIQRAETLKNIHSSFHMASSIASASGQPTKLIFDFEGEKIQVERGSRSSTSPLSENNDENQARVSLFEDVSEFLLPSGTVQNPNSFDFSDNNRFEYQFFSNGEAAGPELEILISGTHPMTIDVDRLTGRPLITENEN